MARKKESAAGAGIPQVLDRETNGAPARGWIDDPLREEKDAAHLEGMKKAPATTVKMIAVPKIDIQNITLKLVGDSSLIVHHWSAKAIKIMLDKQMGNATEGREPKDPERDFRDSLYHHPDGGYGFPAIAFKNAAVTACTSTGKAITKVAARQTFHVVGELVKLEADEPTMREDMVNVGQGTADIRYRAEFKNWWTWITIRFNARVLTAAQLVNLFNFAGFGVGVGEWRSECDGSHGLFHVEGV